MSDTFSHDVFLSHSSKDKAVVRAVAERLRNDGLKVWFDEWSIKAGDNIPHKIEEGLERSRVLVFCMSANAFGSDWATLESQTFRFRDPLNKERRFIPLRLDNAPIKGSLGQFLYVTWLPEDREQAYASLLEACRSLETSLVIDTPEAGTGWSVPDPQNVVSDRSSRDDFLSKTKDTLARRVGMRCSNPACQQLTSGPQSDPNKALNIGVAAHITAAAMDGPRYIASLSKLERSSIENGIWLCQNCAKLVDNDGNRYTIELLQLWKKNAEEMALRYIEKGSTSTTGPQSSRAVRSPEKNAARGKMVGSSPFHPFGAMSLDVKSYIPRSCDNEIKQAAESGAFIWLQGDFQFGKTSLLRRHVSWLPLNWSGVYADAQLFDRSTDSRFRRDFFAEIKKATNQWQHAYLKTQFDWRVLRDLSEHRKIAFLVDEIGRCSEKMMMELIHGFHALADWAPGNIKLVASFRDGPVPLLPNCGVQNPKHTSAWKIIHLGPLTPDEVSRLINFLPNTVSPLLHDRIDRLHAITHFKPQRVQHVLDKIWEAFRSPQAESDLTHSFIDEWLDSEELQ